MLIFLKRIDFLYLYTIIFSISKYLKFTNLLLY